MSKKFVVTKDFLEPPMKLWLMIIPGQAICIIVRAKSEERARAIVEEAEDVAQLDLGCREFTCGELTVEGSEGYHIALHAKRSDTMKKNDIKIGRYYIAKVSGNLTTVRIQGEATYGGWHAKNESTGRIIHVKTAGRLRREVPVNPVPLERIW